MIKHLLKNQLDSGARPCKRDEDRAYRMESQPMHKAEDGHQLSHHRDLRIRLYTMRDIFLHCSQEVRRTYDDLKVTRCALL